MSTTALAATVVLYLMTAVDLFMKGQSWLALAFVCYAVANIAFIGAIQ